MSPTLLSAFVWLWLCLLSLCPQFVLAQEREQVTGELTVFAAASLTEPFTEIGKRLESTHPGLQVRYNFGGSQMLRTQLEHGAQADIFAAADTQQMQLAKNSGIVQGDTPIFVKNKLVVITPRTTSIPVKTLCDLATPGLKLDLAHAKVPVGNYSRHMLKQAEGTCGADFTRRALANIVSEEDNVKQVVTKVQLGEADAGIVYASDVTIKLRPDLHVIDIPEVFNQMATYPIAVLVAVRNRPAAAAFVAFVLSQEGQAILKAHNFIPVQ